MNDKPAFLLGSRFIFTPSISNSIPFPLYMMLIPPPNFRLWRPYKACANFINGCEKLALMSGNVYAIIPVNKLGEAKTRLSDILSVEERGELVQCMLADVLMALNGIETIVVSPSKPSDFKDFDFHFVHEEKKEGLNKAVKKATKYAIEKGADSTLFIPADTPLVTGTHIKEIIELGRWHPLIISPSSRGGTGILFRRPPNVLDNKFSTTSFSDFEKEAAKTGIPMHIYDSYSISLDIDVPEDIREFLLHGKGTKTHDFLVRTLDFPLE